MLQSKQSLPLRPNAVPLTGKKFLNLRPAGLADLPQVNALIESAIYTWDLPERVKRLTMPLYLYHQHDLDFLELMVAEAETGSIVGIAAWEPADPGDAPPAHTVLLLHGIYVSPDHHRKGIGSRLFAAAEKAAALRGFDAVLVKAQPGAEHFFTACGMQRLPVEDQHRDYPHRFWKPMRSF
jgi:GNAT superfamily N-acetyltransferase